MSADTDFDEKIDALTGEVKEAPPAQVPVVADKHARAIVGDGKRPGRPRKEEAAAKQTVSNIAGAIAKITSEVGTVAKAGVNKFHGYKYTTMQDLLEKLTPVLSNNGIVLFQTEVERSLFDNGNVLAVQYEFTIAHSSGEVWPDRPLQTGVSRCRDSKGGYDDKAFNKCHTAARKYFLLALFQIHSDEVEADEDKGRTDERVTTTRKSYPDPAARPDMGPSARDRGRSAARDGKAAPVDLPSSGPAGEDPPPEESSAASPPPEGASKQEITFNRIQELEKELADCAARGWDNLKARWNGLSADEQEALRPALQERYKPMAIETEKKKKQAK